MRDKAKEAVRYLNLTGRWELDVTHDLYYQVHFEVPRRRKDGRLGKRYQWVRAPASLVPEQALIDGAQGRRYYLTGDQ